MITVRTTIKPGENVVTRGLLTNDADQPHTQSSISSLDVLVYEAAALATDLYTPAAPSVASTFYNTLQTGDGWDFDPGYNFKHTVANGDVTGGFKGGHNYLVRYTIVTVQDGNRVMDHWVEVV